MDDVHPSPTSATSDNGLSSAANRTLRVLHVINGEHYSGAERVQDLLGLCLPELGVDVGFACVKPGKFASARQSVRCPIHDAAMGSRFDLRAAWRLASVVRREQYQILHAHTPRSLMVARAAAALTGTPLVYHVHSPTSRDTTHSLRNWLNSAAERWSLSGVGKLICVSNSLGEHMRSQGFAPELIRVVPNGVPCVSDVAPRATPGGTWTIGMVALFRPRKGLEVLLTALAKLRSQGHDVRLRAIGPFETSEYEAAIRKLVDELELAPHIDWIGFTREIPAELNRLDLFVLPSLFGEGLPMVLLEAMAAGVPVVSTNVEGVPEAVRDGIDGLIATAGDADSLAAAIERVVTGQCDWQAIRASALERQRERFSDRSMAAGVAAVYRELLSVPATV
jgi:glycosyltransferase involved in cell wall biosynthesis